MNGPPTYLRPYCVLAILNIKFLSMHKSWMSYTTLDMACDKTSEYFTFYSLLTAVGFRQYISIHTLLAKGNIFIYIYICECACVPFLYNYSKLSRSKTLQIPPTTSHQHRRHKKNIVNARSINRNTSIRLDML